MMKTLRILLVAAIVAAGFQSTGAQAPVPAQAQAQRTPPVATAGQWPTSWRPTIMGKNGMVTSGHPLASAAGLRMLQNGGNAMDAAMAAWAMQGVVESPVTGFAADTFIIFYEAKTKTVKVINGTGYAPAKATIEYYNANGGMPTGGALTTSVPGAMCGAACLATWRRPCEGTAITMIGAPLSAAARSPVGWSPWGNMISGR